MSASCNAQFAPPRQTRQNRLVCVASASAVSVGFPTTQGCSDFVRRSRDSVHTARHDTDNTVLSCLAGGVNWALHDALIGAVRQRRDMIGYNCGTQLGRPVPLSPYLGPVGHPRPPRLGGACPSFRRPVDPGDPVSHPRPYDGARTRPSTDADRPTAGPQTPSSRWNPPVLSQLVLCEHSR